MFKDPLVRRFISGSCFAGAFIFVAVRFFDVETDVVLVLLGFCFAFVGGLIIVGLVLAPIIGLFRSKPAMLSRLEKTELAAQAHDQELMNAADAEANEPKANETRITDTRGNG